MAGSASEFHRGEMDIHAQKATFHAVMNATKWASLTIAAGVLFFTLWFCTTAGFLTAFISALVLVVAGLVVLRGRSPEH